MEQKPRGWVLAEEVSGFDLRVHGTSCVAASDGRATELGTCEIEVQVEGRRRDALGVPEPIRQRDRRGGAGFEHAIGPDTSVEQHLDLAVLEMRSEVAARSCRGLAERVDLLALPVEGGVKVADRVGAAQGRVERHCGRADVVGKQRLDSFRQAPDGAAWRAGAEPPGGGLEGREGELGLLDERHEIDEEAAFDLAERSFRVAHLHATGQHAGLVAKVRGGRWQGVFRSSEHRASPRAAASRRRIRRAPEARPRRAFGARTVGSRPRCRKTGRTCRSGGIHRCRRFAARARRCRRGAPRLRRPGSRFRGPRGRLGRT